MKRRLFIAAIALAAMPGSIPQARALSLDNGFCTWTVTMSFPVGNMKSAATLSLTPDYAFSFARAGDFSVSTPGQQNCLWVVGGGATAKASDISIVPEDSDSAFDTQTCESSTGEGGFSQNFEGLLPADVTNAQYQISGGNTSMTMVVVKDATFISVIQMINPFGPLEWSGCLGPGVDPVTYSSVQFFQDPQL